MCNWLFVYVKWNKERETRTEGTREGSRKRKIIKRRKHGYALECKLKVTYTEWGKSRFTAVNT